MSLLRFEAVKLLGSRRPVVAAVTVVFYLLVLLAGFYTYARNETGGDVEFRYTFENASYFNGLTFCIYVAHFAVLFVLPIFAAAEGAAQIGGERQARTWELLLTRPVGTARLVLGKCAVAFVYVTGLCVLVTGLGLGAGLAFVGLGDLDLYPGVLQLTETHQHLPQAQALQRFALAIPIQALSLLPVLGLGLMLGVWLRHAVGAVAAAIAIYLILAVLGELHFFESLRPWFFTAYGGAWRHVLMEHIPVQQLCVDLLRSLAFALLFLALCFWRLRKAA